LISLDGLVHTKRSAYICWDTKELSGVYGGSGLKAVWRYHVYNPPDASKARIDEASCVFMLPVRIMDADPDGRDYEQPMFAGLLLLPIRSKKGHFRRVGLIEVSEHWFQKGSTKPFTNETRIVDAAYYLEAGKGGQCIIAIVRRSKRLGAR
jgi:hypothetical protein